MKIETLSISLGLFAAAASGFAEDGANDKPNHDGKSGRFLFDKEPFGGNVRTCVTCHSQKTGMVSTCSDERSGGWRR